MTRFDSLSTDQIIFAVAITVAVILAIFFLSTYLEFARRRKIKYFARLHNFEFSANDAFGILEKCKAFGLVNTDRKQRVRNQVYGEYRGFQFCLFDYSFPREDVTGFLSPTALEDGLLVAAKVGIPHKLSISPVNLSPRIVSLKEERKQVFPNLEFDQQYKVFTVDMQLALEFFNTRIMRLFVELDISVSLDISNNMFLFRFVRQKTGDLNYDLMLKTADSILNLLSPEFVTKYAR